MARYLFQGTADSEGRQGPTLRRMADRAMLNKAKREALETAFDVVSPLSLYSPEAQATFVPASAKYGLNVASKAARDLAKGMTAKDVFDKYGVFKGNIDQDLRAVVDDSKARLIADKFEPNRFDPEIVSLPLSSNTYLKLADVLDHPELFKVMPQLKDVNVRPTFGGYGPDASYDSLTNTIRLSANHPDKLSGETLSSLLHETQHAIQHDSNWTKGGSPELFLPTIGGDKPVEWYTKAKQMGSDLQGRYQKELESLPKEEREGSPIKAALDKIKDYMRQFHEIDSKNYQDYRHLGGEAEARAVQNMFQNAVYNKEFQGPLQRYGKQVEPHNPSPYPWDYYDVSADNLIKSRLDDVE